MLVIKLSGIQMYFNLFLKIQRELLHYKQGRKRPLDTPKRMIERREREGKREKER